MIKHNKKRNTGIIYEQIISFMCEKSIEKDKDQIDKALNIVKEHFHDDSQLKKEFKLFNALSTTRNIKRDLAFSIIKESKKASNYHFDEEKLNQEKSDLIRELNYTFGKGEIFKQKVKNYKIYGTIQILLNEWRKPDKDIKILAEFENKLHGYLCDEPEVVAENIIVNDPLVLNIMKEKFDKKYRNVLSESQKNIINIFFNNEEKNIQIAFEKVKNTCLENLKEYKENCENKVLLQKYDNVKKNIESFDNNLINENSLKKVLHMQKLIEDLGE